VAKQYEPATSLGLYTVGGVWMLPLETQIQIGKIQKYTETKRLPRPIALLKHKLETIQLLGR
jgi:hypothetical protein